MAQRIRAVLLPAFFACLVGLVCFAAGGRRGFAHGYLLANRTQEIVAANMVVSSFEAATQGEVANAQELLELVVDSALIAEWSYWQSGSEAPFYAPADHYIDLDRHAGRLARYRRDHPCSHSHQSAEPYIAEVVARYTPPAGTPAR